MTWKQVFTSSVGKKLVMGFTGIFLILFLLVHVGLNLCVFANDDGVMFNSVAHFMGGYWLIRLLEIGLLLGFILHAAQGLILYFENRTKRGAVGYAVSYGNRGSKWYSRNMGLLGILILLFLIVHLGNFWLPNRSHQGWLLGEEINLYEKMKEVFSVWYLVVIYVAACIALAYHLAHGFQSAFRTLGLYNKRWYKIVAFCGYAYAIFIPLLFALIPVSFYFGWIGQY